MTISEMLEAIVNKGLEVSIYVSKSEGEFIYEVSVKDWNSVSGHCYDSGDEIILFISDDTLDEAVQRAYDKLV